MHRSVAGADVEVVEEQLVQPEPVEVLEDLALEAVP